ncbi:PREDICTED: CDC42 small effector protein 2-like [Priapulus caudatus]|uniref:CDC42 small effector protein 2-like n=1 Tax=Priapulus caudatus TaxID=37621 RepID=A0ABM1E078_PRICU|nr:PREDICTED: CDC42 small effector protein 2-like [Priapulus caudatus]
MARTDVFICFTCCVGEQPRVPRRKIDRSQIGQPMNFQHVGHVGSSDVSQPTSQFSSVQYQMQTKGGYQFAVPVNIQMKVRDVQTQR